MFVLDSLLSRAVRAALAVLDAGRWVGLEPGGGVAMVGVALGRGEHKIGWLEG